jgi:hypothetical protein
MYIMATKKTESTASLKDLTRMSKEEAERVLRLLTDAIRKSQRSRRAIERDLGWSQGYLGSILRGRIALKVWHVFAISRQLKLEPLSFFVIASPPRDPNWILEQLGLDPLPPQPAKPEPPKPKTPVDFEALDELTQQLLVEELTRSGLLEPIHSK